MKNAESIQILAGEVSAFANQEPFSAVYCGEQLLLR